MTEAPLTALCGVCHTDPPKYKCPRCTVRTCSLACVTRHKSWASCNGQRDPTVYVPASRLKTPAGIDHDYNFLSAIERVRSRAAQDIADRTGITSAAEQPDDEPHHNHFHRSNKAVQVRFRKEWRGDELVHVPIDPAAYWKQQQLEQALAKSQEYKDEAEDVAADSTSSSGTDSTDDSGSEPEDATSQEPAQSQSQSQPQPRPVVTWYPQSLGNRDKARCRSFDIQVVAAPKGLARQRENKSKGNRSTKGMNWTVEWLVYTSETMTPTRILHTASDIDPIYRSFANSTDWVRRGKERKERVEAAARQNALDAGPYEPNEDIQEGATGHRLKRRRRAHNAVTEASPDHQDPDSTAWPRSPFYQLQNPFTTAWVQEETTSATARAWDSDEELDRKRTDCKYYLHKPATNPKVLIPVEAGEPMTAALQGRTILEFPTIHVFFSDAHARFPPPGYVAGSAKDRRAKPATITSLDPASSIAPNSAHTRPLRGGHRGGQYPQHDRKRPYDGLAGDESRPPPPPPNRGRGQGRGRGRGRGGFGHQDRTGGGHAAKRGRFDFSDRSQGGESGGPMQEEGEVGGDDRPPNQEALEQAVQQAARSALGGLVNYSDSE